MKPLSGMLLYFNLVCAIIWDSLGFLLLILTFIPFIQVLAVILSVILDVVAFGTNFIFNILYQSYVQAYKINLKLYQLNKIKEMLSLSKQKGGNNPVAQRLSKQTQKISKYIVDKFSKYVIAFTVKKIQYLIIAFIVEAIPVIGDLSPSWTIKAYVQLGEHKKTARELSIKNTEFENTLAKWRSSLKVGGISAKVRK